MTNQCDRGRLNMLTIDQRGHGFTPCVLLDGHQGEHELAEGMRAHHAARGNALGPWQTDTEARDLANAIRVREGKPRIDYTGETPATTATDRPMSGERSKDALDHLCVTDRLWISALQVLQLAKKQDSDACVAAAQLVCAIVLLASETTNPQGFLDDCADSLHHTPLHGARK